MEKRVFCQLNGDRKVIGVLRGYDVREHVYLPYEYLLLHWAAGQCEVGFI